MNRTDTALRHGRTAGPADAGSANWWTLAKRSWAEAGKNNLELIAAGIAFNAFLALIPLLTAVVLSYGLFASPAEVAGHIRELADVLPQDAASILGEQLRNMVESAGTATGFGLLLALVVALFGTMRGAKGIITALNIVNRVAERRSFVGQTGVALVIIFGLVLLFILASAAISVVNMAEVLLPDMGGWLRTLLQAAYWIGAASVACAVLGLIYARAPNRAPPGWRRVRPGAILATLVWIAATFGFSFYVRNFGNYNAMYGALGAVIVFLTWLYLSAYILLLGAELNQVLAREAGEASG